MSNNANLAPTPAEGAPSAFTRQAGPTTMEVHAGAAPRRLTVPFVLNNISMTRATATVNFDAVGQLPMFQMFESVRLLDMSFTVVITPGSNKMVYYRIDGDPDTSIAAVENLSGPISGLVPGAQYGVTVQEIPLPSNHSFGRELKAQSLGNDTPKLHLSYTGGTAQSTTADVRVRGTLTLEVGGVGIVSAITL